MSAPKDFLPFLAILIVLMFMGYTNLIIIGEPGRMLSFIPFCAVLIIWGFAILRVRGEEIVH